MKKGRSIMIHKFDVENLWSAIYEFRKRLDKAERIIEILKYQLEDKNKDE